MSPPVFRYPTTLNLRDTDSAGVAFFASYFAIAHNAYEALLKSRGARLSDWLGEVHLPIVHSSADYQAPIRLGDSFDVEVSCTRIGRASFTLSYHFYSADRVSLARLKTVHVAVKVQGESHTSTPLPEQVRELLFEIDRSSYIQEGDS